MEKVERIEGDFKVVWKKVGKGEPVETKIPLKRISKEEFERITFKLMREAIERQEREQKRKQKEKAKQKKAA